MLECLFSGSFHPIAISILFHHYKDLMQCCKKVERLMINNKNRNVKASNTALTADKIRKDIQIEVKQMHQIRQQQRQKELTLF